MPKTSTIRAYPRLTEAEQLYREKKNDAASMVLIQHLREHRDEPRGLALLGEIAIETGGLLQAEQFLRRSIALGNRSLDVNATLRMPSSNKIASWRLPKRSRISKLTSPILRSRWHVR